MALAKSKKEVVQDFRVQTIQEAAARVIAREGMAGATMQAIAAEAGVAKGTLYLYFRDRKELVERTAEHAFSCLQEELSAGLEGDGPFAERLRGFVVSLLLFFENNRDFFRVYLAVRYPSGDAEDAGRVRRPSEVYYQNHLRRLAGVLERAMGAGEVRRGDADRLSLFVTEGLNAIILRRVREDETAPVESEADWLVDTILHGIAGAGRDA